MIAILFSYLVISNQATIINGQINVSSTPSVTALRGNNATLVCQWQEIDNCQVQTSATWFKCVYNDINCTPIHYRHLLDCTEPTTPTLSRNVLERNSCNLSIRNVQLEDGGKYMCQLRSCFSTAQSSELVVNVPPTDMVISNRTHNFTETDNVTSVDPDLAYRLNCSVYGSKPAAELRWILDDRNLTGNVTKTPVITSGNNTGLWNTRSQLTLTGNDGESLVCLASFPGSAIPSRHLQLHLQGDLRSPHLSASTSYTHVTTFTTSKLTTMDDVTDAKYIVVSISVSSCVVFAAVVLVILVVVYRKKKKKKRKNDYQQRQDVVTDHAPEIPARAPPTLPSRASASAVLGTRPKLQKYGQQVLLDNFTRNDSATNDLEMEATVICDVRSHSVELVYADLELNQRAEGKPAQRAEEPTEYARFKYDEHGNFQVSDEDDRPPVPPRLLRKPAAPPDDQRQTDSFNRGTGSKDMPSCLKDYM